MVSLSSNSPRSVTYEDVAEQLDWDGDGCCTGYGGPECDPFSDDGYKASLLTLEEVRRGDVGDQASIG